MVCQVAPKDPAPAAIAATTSESRLTTYLIMNIQAIVEHALDEGYLTPAMEAEVGRICDSAAELSVEEYMALDHLMGALLAGEIVTVPRKTIYQRDGRASHR